MIIWVASYPKSGNTWLRTIISQLIFDKKNQDDKWLLEITKHIDLYPKLKHFNNLNLLTKKKFFTEEETIKNWINSQKKINQNKNIKIFKTHNMFCSINLNDQKYNFTNTENTAGVIHIVRDPRNVITSLKNHFFLKSYDEALNMITNKNKWIGLLASEIPQAIGSWESHYKSWSLFPKNYILFKYEEILANPKKQIERLVKYLEKFARIKYNEEKINNIVKLTSFENLKKLENKGFFAEKSINNQTKKETKFFYLGPKNNYAKILDDKIKYSIEKKFKKTMKLLNYI